MGSKEALNLLSMVKLGCDLGFYPEEKQHVVDELFMETQPAHLQKGSQKKLATEERDILRAGIIRGKLEGFEPPDVSGAMARVEPKAASSAEPPASLPEPPMEGSI